MKGFSIDSNQCKDECCIDYSQQPGDPDNSLQLNRDGNFAGDARLTFDANDSEELILNPLDATLGLSGLDLTNSTVISGNFIRLNVDKRLDIHKSNSNEAGEVAVGELLQIRNVFPNSGAITFGLPTPGSTNVLDAEIDLDAGNSRLGFYGEKGYRKNMMTSTEPVRPTISLVPIGGAANEEDNANAINEIIKTLSTYGLTMMP